MTTDTSDANYHNNVEVMNQISEWNSQFHVIKDAIKYNEIILKSSNNHVSINEKQSAAEELSRLERQLMNLQKNVECKIQDYNQIDEWVSQFQNTQALIQINTNILNISDDFDGLDNEKISVIKELSDLEQFLIDLKKKVEIKIQEHIENGK